MSSTDRALVIGVHDGVDDRVAFWCPGCDSLHQVRVAGERPWGWNKRLDLPTFTPSILLHGWGKKDTPPWQPTCHSFVTDGRIRYLGDSQHQLAGQTVDLPAIAPILDGLKGPKE